MPDNIFLLDESYYQRDLNPLRQYVEQSAFYLSRTRNISIESAEEQVRQAIKNKTFPEARDPVVEYYERPRLEDRELTNAPLSQYLAGISRENLVMAPSLTCYVHPSEKESILTGFTDHNVAHRNVNKKEAARRKALNDIDGYNFYENEQANNKTYNNSLSGAFSSTGSIVRNPSAHSSLTSTTRTLTSIGNASNERLISGNRHYRDGTITLNNVIVLARGADSVQISNTCRQFGIRFPSVQETMDCLRYSTRLYWDDRVYMGKIQSLVEKLSEEERAAVVYTGDLYHLRVLNEDVIRTFIARLSKKITGQVVDNPIAVLRSMDELYINYVHQICMTEAKGFGKDYSIMSIESQNTLACTALHVLEVLKEYRELIRTFFLTRNMPPSISHFRNSIRRTVVLSDTDSTMFSCDEWVIWYFGELLFTDEAFAVSGAVMFMATQCIAHNLALYSATLNVERKKLFMAAMKAEYVFPIFALSGAAKHYFTFIAAKEGSIYSNLEIEIKGVHLKNSASPPDLTKRAQTMMKEVLAIPLSGKKIALTKWVTYVADIEREIKRSILAGETKYLSRLTIKVAESYREGAEQSNYRHHLFWDEIFSPLYGKTPAVPYETVKFPTVLSSKKNIAIWVNNIEDPGLQSRLRGYFDRTQRKDYNTLYVSQDLIDAYGVPKEIKAVVDVEHLVFEHVKVFRLILGSIGFYCKEGLNLTQMGY